MSLGDLGDPRTVIVDDNDGTIRYTGPWFLTDGKDYDDKGDFGKPFSNSLHGTTGDASLSYSFVGSGGRVMGTADLDDAGSSGAIDPTWECLLDGHSIPTNNPPPSATNNFCLCQWDSIPSGSHDITVNVKSQNHEFWFDQIIYLPTSGLVLKNATILVEHTDTAFQYDSGWLPTGTGHQASGHGAVMEFPFFGSSLSWYGTVPGEQPKDASTGFFSIDGQAPTNFTVAESGHHGPLSTQFNQLFFKTPRLPQGNHILTVTSQGTAQSAPLVFSYLVVDNGELPAPVASPSTSPQPSSTKFAPGHHFGNASGNGKSHAWSKNFPYIIGGAIGAFFLFLLVACIFFFLSGRSKTKLVSVESADKPPHYASRRNISQLSGNPASQPGRVGSQQYPFALQSMPSRYNFTKRFTSSSTRPNSLFPTSRLSPLPTKREPSMASTSRTYRPYLSRPWFGSSYRSSSGSSATLLDYTSGPPSRESSLRSIPDDQTVVVDHKDSGTRLPHARPPEAIVNPPNYTPG